MNVLRILFVAAACAAACWSQQPEASVDTAFADASRLYREQRYGPALETFAAALEREDDAGRRAVLHLNAGTSAARAERLGEAVWHLEAARRLDPSLHEAPTNLKMVRARLHADDEEGAPPPSFFETVWRVPLLTTATASRRAAGALVALALLGLAAWRAGRWGRRGAWASLALLAAAGVWVLFDDAARRHDLERAVVVGEAVAVRGEPQENVDVLYRLSAGAIVRVERELDGWRLVTTSDDVRGWVGADEVRPVGR